MKFVNEIKKRWIRYKALVSLDVFYLHSSFFLGSNFHIEGSFLQVTLSESDKKRLDYYNIPYKITQITYKHSPKKGMIAITLFLISVFFFSVSKKTIFKIKFNGEYPINFEIKQKILEECFTIGGISFSNIDYQSFSSKIRKNYIEYPWISIYQKGNIIYCDIDTSNSLEEKIVQEIPGSIYSLYTGVVIEYRVYRGLPLFKENEYVQKGQKLISSDLMEKSEIPHEIHPVEANGFYYLNIFEKKIVRVEKELSCSSYTGKLENITEIYWRNFKLYSSSKNEFKSYDKKIILEKKYFLGFTKKVVQSSEKNDIIVLYTGQEALLYAKNKILLDFKEEHPLEKEEIQRIECLKKIETEKYYQFEFFVQSKLQAGVFQKE